LKFVGKIFMTNIRRIIKYIPYILSLIILLYFSYAVGMVVSGMYIGDLTEIENILSGYSFFHKFIISVLNICVIFFPGIFIYIIISIISSEIIDFIKKNK